MNRSIVLRAAAMALLVWAILLHSVFFVSAGGLWRDEANSVAQANLPSWQELTRSLEYDSFPLLYPALLRAWSHVVPAGSDTGMRVLGLIVGVAFVLSLPAAARVAGFSWPAAALVLAASGPLFVTETDSLRPYGIGFVCLVWSFAFFARSLATGAPRWIAAATLACTLAVQASYSNAAQVGALGLCAAVASRRGNPASPWRWLLPPSVAALSLVLYVGVLKRASEWAALVRQPVDWGAFAARFVDTHVWLFAVPWFAFAFLAWAGRRGRGGDGLRLYCGLVLAAALPAQLAMLELLRVAPFPRYFLPALVSMVLALDGLAGRLAAARAGLAVAVAALLALPSWSLVRQRRTNADEAGAAIAERATSRDLVLVSPWFLHESFQRYYRGPAPWSTVPDMPVTAMMRYDLVGRAMLDPGSFERISENIRATLARRGVVWLVTQRQFRSSPGSRIPHRPELSGPPGGGDYVRFRSYWEDGVEYALASCCAGEEVDTRSRSVWTEEDLLVVKWVAQR